MSTEHDEGEHYAGECPPGFHCCVCAEDSLRKQLTKARAAIVTLREYAKQTYDHWQADEDHKVGKRLKAMAGLMPSYDAEVTEALGTAVVMEIGEAKES